MYFKFPCTHCGKNLKARDEHVGRKVGCPYCKGAVIVPEPPAPESEEAPASPEAFSPTDSASPPRGPAQRPAAPRSTASTGRRTDGTNVSLLWTGVVAAAATIGFYALMFVIQKTYFAVLFLQRGWVPYAEVFFMMWSLAILFVKYRKLARQRAAMLFDLLPTELSEEITLDKIDAFTRHIRGLPGDQSGSFLINRVLRGLEHFRVRKSAPEVASILASQSEMDASSVASSYTMIKVFIWAIPILGFIGTVIGISQAVSGFSGQSDINAIKESLDGVTSGLSTAFDTTLLALVMSMFIKFPTSSLQKSEEDMLGWVDEYCNENLLKRLNDGRDGGAERGAGGGRSAVQQAVDAAMREHHVELRSWTQRLESLGTVLSSDVVRGWSEINQQMLAQTQQEQSRRMADAQTLQAMVDDFQATLNGVQQGLHGLNEVLAGLGERQISIEVVPAPESAGRGWRFWRAPNAGKRNGAP